MAKRSSYSLQNVTRKNSECFHDLDVPKVHLSLSNVTSNRIAPAVD